MFEENSFDEVFDCQESFRLLLYAVSNPGEIVTGVRKHPEVKEEIDGRLMTLALTLLDKETSFSGENSALFAKTAAELTYSKLIDKNADFYFITEKSSPEGIKDIFSRVTPGSLVEPHRGSVLIIAVNAFEEEGSCILTGPGIKGAKQARLSQYAKQWIAQRDLNNYEYPTGIDLYFVSPLGEIMSVPRKVKMEG